MSHLKHDWNRLLSLAAVCCTQILRKRFWSDPVRAIRENQEDNKHLMNEFYSCMPTQFYVTLCSLSFDHQFDDMLSQTEETIRLTITNCCNNIDPNSNWVGILFISTLFALKVNSSRCHSQWIFISILSAQRNYYRSDKNRIVRQKWGWTWKCLITFFVGGLGNPGGPFSESAELTLVTLEHFEKFKMASSFFETAAILVSQWHNFQMILEKVSVDSLTPKTYV